MILIAAYKSSAYGKFAYNLAHSIKDKTDLPICLLTDGKIGIDTSVFDHVIQIETPEDPCLFKINLNKHTPFDKTLYLDADMLCMNDIQPLIEYLDGKSFWVDTLRDNQSFWLKDDAFDWHFQETNTSIFYWEKGFESDKYFDSLNTLFNNIDRSLYKIFWGKQNFIPDESLHSKVLSALNIIFEHTHPVFYCDHSKPRPDIIKHYFLSMYGARIATQNSKDIYDSFMNSVMLKVGKHHEYKIDQLYRKKFVAL